MKKLFFTAVLGLIFYTQVHAQKYYTKTGSLKFEASVEAFEPVKAAHENTTAVVDVAAGKLAVLSLVKGFRFKNALMEEHFNENYMESDKFPKTQFAGTIKDFSIEKLASQKEFEIEGDLTIHGKTKPITTTGTVVKEGNNLVLATNFSVLPEDYNIEIPNVVKEKIAGKINISANFKLAKR